MTPYADYCFYSNAYKGNVLEPTEFPRLAMRATIFLNYYTRGKATQDNEAVKLACCALAEQYQSIVKSKSAAASENGEMQSQSVGAYSVTYRSSAEVSANAEAELRRIAQMYLAGTGLLYRGGCYVCSAHDNSL